MYGASNEIQSTQYEITSSLQSQKGIANTAQGFSDPLHLARASYNSAGAELSKQFKPFAREPNHNTLPTVFDNRVDARQSIYEQTDNFSNEDLTFWRT
jgi:hypothetical protein